MEIILLYSTDKTIKIIYVTISYLLEVLMTVGLARVLLCNIGITGSLNHRNW